MEVIEITKAALDSFGMLMRLIRTGTPAWPWSRTRPKPWRT